MSVNITADGRRTASPEIEWFSRPDGMERAVIFRPGYNGDPDAPPSRNYGVHGMEIAWYLRGPKGVTQFVMFTRWVPGELSPGHGLPPDGYPPRPGDQYPDGANLGYHAPVPQYDGDGYVRGDCAFLPGGRCYYDGSGLAAMDLAREFVEKGEAAVWAALEDRYRDLKAES